jgi:hypothetical protein
MSLVGFGLLGTTYTVLVLGTIFGVNPGVEITWKKRRLVKFS